MKKYLFGLGAMLVGAGLMFVLMHGEVRADSISKDLSNVDENSVCEYIKVKTTNTTNEKKASIKMFCCKIRDFTCLQSDFTGKHCFHNKGGFFK